MQSIRNLNDMIVFLQQRGDRKRVAVVCANDASTRYALEKGREMGFIEPIYVDGDDIKCHLFILTVNLPDRLSL